MAEHTAVGRRDYQHVPVLECYLPHFVGYFVNLGSVDGNVGGLGGQEIGKLRDSSFEELDG